jgi:hypothetical protein
VPIAPSLPARWLLKLLPADAAPLPDSFWKSTWTSGTSPRGWTEWLTFGRNVKNEGEVTITRREGFPGGERVKARTVPLAVAGPLVEFDKKLYTVAITERKSADGTQVTPLLTLGAAVEVKPNVWYQAYSEEFPDGKARVTELLAEFAVDPRANEDGKVKFRKFVRTLSDREGALTEYDGTFTKGRGRSGPAVRIADSVQVGELGTVSRVWMDLPSKEFPARFDTSPAVTLAATTDAAPKPPQANATGLVEPPPPPAPPAPPVPPAKP